MSSTSALSDSISTPSYREGPPLSGFGLAQHAPQSPPCASRSSNTWTHAAELKCRFQPPARLLRSSCTRATTEAGDVILWKCYVAAFLHLSAVFSQRWRLFSPRESALRPYT